MLTLATGAALAATPALRPPRWEGSRRRPVMGGQQEPSDRADKGKTAPLDLLVACQEDQVFGGRRGREQPIKRIVMHVPELPYGFHVPCIDRQHPEALNINKNMASRLSWIGASGRGSLPLAFLSSISQRLATLTVQSASAINVRAALPRRRSPVIHQ